MLEWRPSEKRTYSKLFSIFICLSILTISQAEVSFVDDIWGDIKVKIGHVQNIGCTVTDGGPRHEMKWTLGDKVLTDTYTKESEDGVVEHYIKFTPTQEDDGKLLDCSFGGNNDEVRLRVYQLDIEEGPTDTVTMTMGKTTSVEILAKLYPPPANDDVTWRDGGEVHIHPGQTMDIYNAKSIQQIQGSENLHKLVLEITPNNKSVSNGQHSVDIIARGNKKTISFNVNFQPEVMAEGVPSWVWILLVLVVLFGLVVVFIVVRNNRKKKESTAKEAKDNNDDKEQETLLLKQVPK